MNSGKQMDRLQEVRAMREADQVDNTHQEIHTSPSKKVSHIDGIGLWNSFTRSFKSPLMACFDLIDNVFDASPQFQGRLNIDVDVEEFDRDDDPMKLDITNGFYILNNCQNPVKPMEDVLTVFNSDKRNARSQIGENGVGVKQGCATLSDISFVVSRNEQVYSLGVLARPLQKPSGPYFPSFDFQFDPENNRDLCQFLMLEITTIVSSVENKEIAAVIKEYGHGDIEKGKYRLIKNIMRLNDGEWSDEKYVFSICVHDLKHGRNIDFLVDLENELPEHYLHVPHNFQVWFGVHRVKFNHWPNRLVNLTRFNVRIPKDEPIEKDSFDKSGNYIQTETDHSLNIYLGFDAIKIEEKGQNEAMLYFYSRKFGRLIKYETDCRGMLWLSAGSSNYCQALTIIVDDKSGALPLNPAKQDFAWSEHINSNGDKVWEKNLLKWVSAATKMYYNYYLVEVCNKSKKLLTDLVKSKHERAKEKKKKMLLSDGKAIDERRVSFFENTQWEFKSGKIMLTPTSKKRVKHIVGADVDLYFEKKSTNDQDMTSATATAIATATAMATISVRRARSGPKRYREDSEPDEEEEQEDTSRSKTPSKSRRLEIENAQLKKEVADLKQEVASLTEERQNDKTDIQFLEEKEKELTTILSQKNREINRLRRDLERATTTSSTTGTMDF